MLCRPERRRFFALSVTIRGAPRRQSHKAETERHPGAAPIAPPRLSACPTRRSSSARIGRLPLGPARPAWLPGPHSSARSGRWRRRRPAPSAVGRARRGCRPAARALSRWLIPSRKLSRPGQATTISAPACGRNLWRDLLGGGAMGQCKNEEGGDQGVSHWRGPSFFAPKLHRPTRGQGATRRTACARRWCRLGTPPC